MHMSSCETLLTMAVMTRFLSRNRHRQNGLVTRHLHENHPSLPPFSSKWRDDEFETWDSLLSFSFWLMRGQRWLSSTSVRYGKILVKLEKFAKVSESLIKFLYFLKLRSLKGLAWMRRRWMKATYSKQLDELSYGKRTHMTTPMCESWTVCGLQDCETTATAWQTTPVYTGLYTGRPYVRSACAWSDRMRLWPRGRPRNCVQALKRYCVACFMSTVTSFWQWFLNLWPGMFFNEKFKINASSKG